MKMNIEWNNLEDNYFKIIDRINQKYKLNQLLPALRLKNKKYVVLNLDKMKDLYQKPETELFKLNISALTELCDSCFIDKNHKFSHGSIEYSLTLNGMLNPYFMTTLSDYTLSNASFYEKKLKMSLAHNAKELDNVLNKKKLINKFALSFIDICQEIKSLQILTIDSIGSTILKYIDHEIICEVLEELKQKRI